MHRGQEGRAPSGFQPGGKCYGYRNVPIEDPTRSGKYGRFAVSGVKPEVVEEEAAVVQRIFGMYADGNSQVVIAKTLNAEGSWSSASTEQADESTVHFLHSRDASQRALSRSVRLEPHQEGAQSRDGTKDQQAASAVGMEAHRRSRVANCLGKSSGSACRRGFASLLSALPANSWEDSHAPSVAGANIFIKRPSYLRDLVAPNWSL